MTFNGTVFCKVCGRKIAEARGVLPREKASHEAKAPFLFVCLASPTHNNGKIGNFRVEWEEVVPSVT